MDDVWQQPIVYGEEVVAAKAATQDDPAESSIAKPTEEPQDKAANAAEVGSESETSFQESLQALADGMEARREQDIHTEIDRELGLVFRNDHDLRWCDHESAIDRRHLHYSRRAQDDRAMLNLGTTVGVDETFPTSPYLFPPKHAIWGVPREPPLSHTQVLGEKDIEGRYVPPVLVPSDGTIARPAPPTPEQHLAPQHTGNRSRLLAGPDMFGGQTARIGGLGELEKCFQQRSTGRHQRRHDADGSGIAVARARHRLDSFRTARKIVSTNTNSDRGHENVPSQVAEDQNVMPPFQDGAKAMLGRLKEMRCSVGA